MYKTLVRFGFHPCSFNICFLTELFVASRTVGAGSETDKSFSIGEKTFLAMETLFYRICIDIFLTCTRLVFAGLKQKK